MINKISLVFSKSSCARVLGVSASQIKDFRVWDKVCFVVVKGQRPTFVSKKLFKAEFVRFRQAQGVELFQGDKVSKLSQRLYSVASNSSKVGFYTVRINPDSVECECEDYNNQIKFIGKAVCKHSYAVISALGLNSFAQYLEAAELALRPRPMLSDRIDRAASPRTQYRSGMHRLAMCG